MKHGFIGFGNLAKAIFNGLRNEKDMAFACFDRFKKEEDIQKEGINSYDNIEDLVLFADTIWLTVKPQDLPDVLLDLKEFSLEGKAIISPVAGKSIAYIEQFLGDKPLIVRIMPNLAMAYRASVTAFHSNSPENEQSAEIYSILGKLGKVISIKENEFDLFTSIFGSGPAFILSVIEAFKNKLQEFNLTKQVEDELLLELIKGTTLYFMHNREDHTIEDLVKNITSKGGTTRAGLDYFHAHEIGKQLEGVIEAARVRSKSLEDI